MADPLHKSKRVYAIAALLAPHVVRLLISKTGLVLHEDLMLMINSTVTEALSVGIATLLIGWSKITERVANGGVCGETGVNSDAAR